MLNPKQVVRNELRRVLLLMLVFCALPLIAGNPVKKMEERSIPISVNEASNGDFVSDTVNVFKIARDVSQIFVEAMKYTSLNDINGDTVYLNNLFTTDYASRDVAEAYKADVKAKIGAERGDFGLDLRADYTENFIPGISYDEEIYYKRRFLFGVEWDVLKGGFLETRANIRQLKSEYQLKDEDAKKLADAENYRYIFNYINYIFNKQKIDVLLERYELIEQQLKFTTELYHLRYVGWERVLKIRAKLEDLDQHIAQLKNFNQHIPNNIPDALLENGFSAESLPLVDVDLDKLMQVYHDNSTTESIAAIKLAMYDRGMNWWKDISLKPFVRYNIIMDEFNYMRNYGSAGVSLNLPLKIRNKSKLVEAKKAIFDAEGMSEFQAGDNELVNQYAEFAFKLKQIKEFYYKKLFADELIRKELVKKDYKDMGFNPIFTLGLIDDKKNIEAEIIDIKKMLYKNLVQMAFYLDKKSPLSFVEVLNPNDFTSRYSTGVQLFVDQATFDRMSNNEFTNYLWKNEFRDVVLEIDSWDLNQKVIDAIEKASRDHVYFSFNMNIPAGQAFPDVQSDLARIKAFDNKYINGLHYSLQMDKNYGDAIEIQEVAFSDWVNGIDVNQKPEDIRLSITISDNLPMNILNRVYNKFDLVFVPSDGTPNRQKLEEKLIQELSLGKDKLTVVLNSNDFADRVHIENYMANISQETGVENFAFSNIANTIHADLRSYEMGEKYNIGATDIMSAFQNQIFSDEQENKKILQDKLDDIGNIVDERNRQVAAENQQKISIEITDKREGNVARQESIVNPVLTSSRSSSTAVKSTLKGWQIQIAASRTNLSDQYLKNKFKVKEDISIHRLNGLYKYTFGNYSTENEAKKALSTYKRESANWGAFLVSYE